MALNWVTGSTTEAFDFGHAWHTQYEFLSVFTGGEATAVVAVPAALGRHSPPAGD